MNRLFASAILVLVLVIAGLATTFTETHAQPDSATASSVKWEYLCFTGKAHPMTGAVSDATFKRMSEEGAKGWELVTIYGANLCFKRKQ